MPRRLLHIPRHTLRIAAVVVFIGIILFFALTRTQVGRDGLRYQIERQFAAAFEGRLEIGQLTGNLAQDLFASQVRLYDAEGLLVVEIDSVVAHPRWTSLFQQRLSIRSLTLFRPQVSLHYRADSTWNVARVFRKRLPNPPGDGSTWRYDSAHLTLVDGTIRASHDEAVPRLVEQGWLFDFDDATLEDVQVDATVEWGRATKLIDVLDFSANLPEADWTIDKMQGQFLREGQSLLLNEFMLQGGETDLHMDLALDHLGTPDSLSLDVRVQEGYLDNNAVRRLVPRFPLANLLTFSGHVEGMLPDLRAEGLTLEHGNSRLETNGTFSLGSDSLTFDATFRNSRVASRDIRTLLPGVALPDLDHLGLVAFDADAEGSIMPGRAERTWRLRTEADVDVRARPGHVEGTVSLAWRGKAPTRYKLNLRTDSLDVGLLLRDERLSSNLNGRISLEGRSLLLDSLDATLQADLRASMLAGRRIDSLHAEGQMAGRQLQVQGYARQRNGRLVADGEVDLRGASPVYRLDLITRQLDAGPLLGIDSLNTALNAAWNLTGSGSSLAEATGALRVQFEESQVRFKDEEWRIPTHFTTVMLAPPAPQQPRVQVDGDMLALNLYGDTPPGAVQALANLWYHAANDAVERQQQKTYRRNQDELAVPLATLRTPALAQPARQTDAREALQANGLNALALDLDVRVKDPDLLAAFFPMLPAVPPDFTSELHFEADADRLHLTASVAGDSLRISPVRADLLAAYVEASINLSAPLEQTLTAQIDLRADSLLVAGQSFGASEISMSYADLQGHLTLQTQQPDAETLSRLAATLDVLPDRNRLTLQEVALPLGKAVWLLPNPEPIDLYAGAIVFPDLLLASTLNDASTSDDSKTQQVRLYGSLSRAPQDTFFVEVADIGLRDLGSLRLFNRALGGQLNGQIALTNASRPELTGRVVVDALSLDNDILGRLEATSRYVPGSPDVVLDALLAPMEADSASSNPFVRNNRLHLAGSFRLPQAATENRVRDPGVLDLTLDAERADLFFFEYLFSDLITNATGSLAGTGAIRGTFDYPLFEADLRLDDGSFSLPKFNLAFQIDGDVRVDDEAIRLDGVSLRDKTGGSTLVNGALLFNDYRFFSFDLAAQLRDMQIIDVPTSRELPFYGSIWASGNATLTGPLFQAQLTANNVTTTAQSEIFIPITESETEVDPGFIVFTDSTGQVPDLAQLTRRKNIISSRPEGERSFLDGMEMDLNILAPQGSTVHLVIDPLLGDVINAIGSGRIQLLRQEGDFQAFGSFTADSGDYLFTAGEVFVRRFLIESGTITWDSDPLNARLDIQADYRTRASRTGLPTDIADRLQSLIPLVVNLHITGRVAAPQVALNLAVDRSTREPISDAQFLETYLNQPDRAAQLATSVLLTNSFILTTDGSSENGALAGSAFNSVSQLVSSQLNRYLSQVVPNADFSFGVQGDETAEDLDLTAGLAIRLLDERLVIRGQGVYRGIRQAPDEVNTIANQGLQGEFAVEVKLSSSVSVEVFYRREGDVFSESILTNTTGAGLSYKTQFATWSKLYQRIFGTSDTPETATATELPPSDAGGN